MVRLPSNDGNASKGKQQTSEPVHILKRSFARTVSVVSVCQFSFILLFVLSPVLTCPPCPPQECFESLLSILHWSWTTLVLGVEELRGLKGFQYTATLLDLERLRFVGTCCLRLLRVYICEIFPIAGERKQADKERVSAAEKNTDDTLIYTHLPGDTCRLKGKKQVKKSGPITAHVTSGVDKSTENNRNLNNMKSEVQPT